MRVVILKHFHIRLGLIFRLGATPILQSVPASSRKSSFKRCLHTLNLSFFSSDTPVMSVKNLSGLAALTATYTDSEGEDDTGDVSSLPPGKVKIPTPVGKSQAPSVRKRKSKKLARLVSYTDDTLIVSDEDEDEEEISESESEIEVEEASESKIEEEVPEEEPEESSPDDVKLPPEPPGPCAKDLQDRITLMFDKLKRNKNVLKNSFNGKQYRNPSIYEKLLDVCDINELGTNYPAELFDPSMWGKDSFYEELAKAQKADMERREKERKEKTKVEVITGTAKRTSSGKSKWDQVGGIGGSVSIAAPIIQPISLMQQPTLTTNATGTKGTVISAFGFLQRKPKS